MNSRGRAHRRAGVHRKAVIVLTLLLLALPGAARAVSEEATLPLRSVTLYSSGVGHFVHSGQVSGTVEIVIPVPRTALDDVLKTLTVEDISGGTVRAVDYQVSDPLSRRLGRLPLKPEGTLLSLLQGMTGETISVGSGALRGTLISAEPVAETDSGAVVLLMLLTADGLQSVGVGLDSRIAVEDAGLRAQLAEALDMIRTARTVDSRELIVRAEGRGTRTIVAAYVREVPVWKATYRLVIGDGDRHLLQGWALVENPVGEQWQNVSLTLVAGDPVSFRMPLASPLYRERPYTGFPLSETVLPPHYADALPGRGGAEELAAAPPSERRSIQVDRAEVFAGRGVESAADAQPAGVFHRYVVRRPVSMAAGSASMVPIVQSHVAAELLSIYDPQTHASLPMSGVRLVNSSGAALSAGPIVVYEGGGYAGEAVLRYLGQGGERLLSFSYDQRTAVNLQTDMTPERVTRIRIDRGVMTTISSLRRQHRYRIDSRDAAARTLLIQHRREGDWRLVEPARPDEQYADGYRFRVELDAVGGSELLVTEERARTERVSLSTISADRIQVLLSQREIPPAVREALARIRSLQSDYAAAREQRRSVEQRIDEIYREQERIRANMAALDHASDLYQRYVAELTQQEDRLAVLRDRLHDARAIEQRRAAALERFIANLAID
ncbi:MAG: hypothetical protein EA384_13815 [Spirochaetaceae bacterium]|nr:MAG: hypothetical protein EA384_13815 [Spirochaetaceae bacterium]